MRVDEEASLAVGQTEPHPGCNCGRRRPAVAAPLLTPDLVIAARDRAREPELAEATVAHALATPVPIQLAKYAVVIVAGSLGSTEREERLAAEFARHEHRVFHLSRHQHQGRHDAPTLQRVTLPAAALANSQDLAAALQTLRRQEAIEAAVLFAPLMLEEAVAHEIRQRWSWRMVTTAAAPNAGACDLRLAFEGAIVRDGDLALSREMPWPTRWAEIDRALRALWPRASVVVLTHDNLVFNRLCIGSVLANTEYPNYELIVVDNASQDGTLEELRRLESTVPHVRVIRNEHNAGFGPGNNQGLAAATGEILVLLNNDTVVPRGWLTRLARHLDDPRLGLVGPGTNRTCNEAQIDIPYQTYAEYQSVARQQSERHEGERYPIRMPMMFCTAFRRDAFERIGPLDERFAVGMFEDEDYALRAKDLGYEVAWTPEVYVHHAYHASIGKLLPTGEYMRLVKLNQGRFEEKWGICWERHRPPPAPAS